MEFESITHAQHYAAGSKIDIVILNGKIIDVSEFKQHHPGN